MKKYIKYQKKLHELKVELVSEIAELIEKEEPLTGDYIEFDEVLPDDVDNMLHGIYYNKEQSGYYVMMSLINQDDSYPLSDCDLNILCNIMEILEEQRYSVVI